MWGGVRAWFWLLPWGQQPKAPHPPFVVVAVMAERGVPAGGGAGATPDSTQVSGALGGCGARPGAMSSWRQIYPLFKLHPL